MISHTVVNTLALQELYQSNAWPFVELSANPAQPRAVPAHEAPMRLVITRLLLQA